MYTYVHVQLQVAIYCHRRRYRLNHLATVLAQTGCTSDSSVLMEHFSCNLCLVTSKQKYRLFDEKLTGGHTEAGKILQETTALPIPTHIRFVCKPCRDAILQVRKMQLNLQQRINDLKTKLKAKSVSILTPKRTPASISVGLKKKIQTIPVSTSALKRTLFPASLSTGMSPSAKRQHYKHIAARELFPSKSLQSVTTSATDQWATTQGQMLSAIHFLPDITPRLIPPRENVKLPIAPKHIHPLSPRENVPPSRLISASSPSRIPVREAVTVNESTNEDVIVRQQLLSHFV